MKFIPLILILLIACTPVHQQINEMSLAGIEDTKIAKDTTKNLLETWPYRSGIIREFYRYHGHEYSSLLRGVIQTLDNLAKIEKPTDAQLGEATGAFLLLFKAGAEETLDKYNVNLLEILGIALIVILWYINPQQKEVHPQI
jgi:hypothetical protein